MMKLLEKVDANEKESERLNDKANVNEKKSERLFDKINTNEKKSERLFERMDTEEKNEEVSEEAEEKPKEKLFEHLQENIKETGLESAVIGQEGESEQIEKTELSKERSRLFTRVDNGIEGLELNCSLKNVVTAAVTPKFRVGDFWYEEGELKYQSKEMSSAVVIGNFWIEIKEEITHVTEICNEQNLIIGYREDTSWKVEIHCMGQKFETEKTVKGLLSDTELLKITRDRGYLESEKESKRLFRKYINVLISKNSYVKTCLYNTTGWIKMKGGKFVYLTKEGIIGERAGNIKADVPYHFLYRPEKVGTKEIFDEFLGMRELCSGNGKRENSIFLTHFSCVSVMTTLFQDAGKGVNFIVALIGSTNSQKTAAGLLFSRLFDRTPSYLPDLRSDSTLAAIREKMSLYGDAMLMVDDFVPFSSKGLAAEQRKKSETLIRGYGDREPFKRSETFAKIYDVSAYSPVKGCCLITGEMLQTESESSDTRVIRLQFERGDVDLERLTHYQDTLLNFPTFFYDFIAFLQGNVAWAQNIMREELKRIRKQKIPGITTSRFIDTLAIMSAEVRIFYSYACAKGFLTADEAQKYLKEDMQEIMKVIIKNDRESKTKSPAAHIIMALKCGIQSGKVLLCSMEDMSRHGEFSKIMSEDEQYFYILPETLWQLYRDYCKNVGEELIYKSGRDLNAPLKKENLLLIKTEGKNQQQRATHKIGNFTSKRFFLIKKLELKKILDIMENF